MNTDTFFVQMEENFAQNSGTVDKVFLSQTLSVGAVTHRHRDVVQLLKYVLQSWLRTF